MFWRRVIIAFAIICVFYMLVALCIALRQLGGGVPIKFDPLSWPIELLEQLTFAPHGPRADSSVLEQGFIICLSGMAPRAYLMPLANFSITGQFTSRSVVPYT